MVGSNKSVSVQYASSMVRVRKMDGRTWLEVRDFQIQEGWSGELYQWLDQHFQYGGFHDGGVVLTDANVGLGDQIRPPFGAADRLA